jgi:NSS family neurotransmitter:Na+ symporter
MAAVGFAIGLGNIWRFPYVTGENGGAAFVLVYLGCVLLIGLPIVMAEIALGRRGGGDPPLAFAALALQSSASRRWSWVGHLNLGTAFLVMATYATVGGWVLYYLWSAANGAFVTMDQMGAEQYFDGLLASPGVMFFWMAMALTLTGMIIVLGVVNGIERAVRVLMPMLFFLMVGLVIYNATDPSFGEGWSYLFEADFTKINGSVFLAAIGQAFFSIGVALAGMMIFGAYLPKGQSIARFSVLIIIADTAIALLAGLMIFPLVFRYGLDPAGGVGLIFEVLPIAFGQLPAGIVIGTGFFLLLAVAAITSMVGFVEPLVATWSRITGRSRKISVFQVVMSLMGVSIASILTYSHFADQRLFGLDANGLVDFLSNQIMLPMGGLLIAIFSGWVLSPLVLAEEFGFSKPWQFRCLHGLLRYLVPIAVMLILITGLS